MRSKLVWAALVAVAMLAFKPVQAEDSAASAALRRMATMKAV